MAPRVVAADGDAWQRLATAVAERRAELGLTQAETVRASGDGISLPVWSILENARQVKGTMQPRSLRAAAKALRWPADALTRILEDPSYVPPDGSTGESVLDAIDADPDLDEAGRDAVRRVYLIAKSNVDQS